MHDAVNMKIKWQVFLTEEESAIRLAPERDIKNDVLILELCPSLLPIIGSTVQSQQVGHLSIWS